jgi:hypothetical protein
VGGGTSGNMSRLDHVMQVGVALREAAPAPKPTEGLFWTSENEKVAYDYVKLWWWKHRFERKGEKDKANTYLKAMNKQVPVMEDKMRTKMSFERPFPNKAHVQSVTDKLVNQYWLKVPWDQMNPEALETIAKQLWSELKKYVREKPSMFDGKKSTSTGAALRPYAPPELPRKILFLKGRTYGIPEAKLDEATATAMAIIEREKITTIAWDGDKLGYTGPDGEPPPMTFTFVLHKLQKLAPWLEFMYFKKAGNGRVLELLQDVGRVELDEAARKASAARGVEVIQYLGPMPFLNRRNTAIVAPGEPIPPRRRGFHVGIELEEPEKWWQLGLKGLEIAKSQLGNDRVAYLVVGLGGVAVKKELEKVAESYEKGEHKYPLGLTMAEVAKVEF